MVRELWLKKWNWMMNLGRLILRIASCPIGLATMINILKIQWLIILQKNIILPMDNRYWKVQNLHQAKLQENKSHLVLIPLFTPMILWTNNSEKWTCITNHQMEAAELGRTTKKIAIKMNKSKEAHTKLKIKID